jgi:hypothetical protein
MHAGSPGPADAGSLEVPTQDLPAREKETMPRTLDDYAVSLAALKAYDITGVRPRDLRRFRDFGELPEGVPEAVVLRAQHIVEEERDRLLRLTTGS